MERLNPHHLAEFVQWCPSLAGGHRLTEAELNAALFPEDQPTWVFGDPQTGVVTTARAGTRGFVRLLAVAEHHRRHGVGRELLAAAERQLADHGAVDVVLGADTPHHLWAGVPTAATAMCCLHTMGDRGDDIAAVQWVGPLRPYVELGGRISQQYLVYRKALT